MMRVTVLFILVFLLAGPALDVGLFAAPVQEQPEDEVIVRPPLAIPEGYRYDPAGRRDPFVDPQPPPPVVFVDPGPVIPDARPQGLPGVLLNEAQLMGVVSSSDARMNVVLIQAPGDRTFVARPGDELFDVIITEIRSNSVVFEVKPLEGSTEPDEREEVVRPISAAPGE
jgi:hypothetical protein